MSLTQFQKQMEEILVLTGLRAIHSFVILPVKMVAFVFDLLCLEINF